MKLLANCQPSGQKDSYTLSSGGCFIYPFCTDLVYQRKPQLEFVRSEHCCGVFSVKKNGLPDYIDSSTVKSLGIRGQKRYVFVLSR